MIDKVGGRYALTVRCDGVHRIYVHVPSTVDLQKFVGKSVRARYRYVEEHNPHTRCVRAPCPPATERVLDVIELVEVPGSLPEGKRLPGEGPGAGSNPSSQTERRP
jgi:hypothetical protein